MDDIEVALKNCKDAIEEAETFRTDPRTITVWTSDLKVLMEAAWQYLDLCD